MAAEKTRNNGQWTDSRFNAFVKSALRAAMRRWPPKWDCLKDAFVGLKVNVKTKREGKHYRCAKCQGEFSSTQVQVDHIIPIGFEKTWDEVVAAMFCEKQNLQVLCLECHKKKTLDERQRNKSL